MRGKIVTYSYDQNKGVLNWVKDPDNNQTNYTYDADTDVLKSTSGVTTNTGASQTVTNSYVYNNDRLASITHNGFDYNFTYDLFGRAESTKVGSQVLNTNTYDTKGLLSKTTYGNGDYIEPVYNNLDQIVEKKYNGTSKYKWEYGTDGSVNKHIDLVNGVTYRYKYDLAGRLRRVYGNDGYKQRNLYDAKGNIYNTLYTFENNSYIKKYSNNYVYGNDNRINQVHFNQTAVDLDRTYDTLGRVTQKKYSQWGGSPFFTTSYSFLAGANDNTTGMLSSINNKGETISYTYDNRGNITAINEGSTQKVKYTYDELNQLIREDSVYLNKSVIYTYDVGGNLAAKKEYTYTTGALGTATKTINYTYGDSNWKDKLTVYDGKAITYNTMGNTKTYDGNTFEWTGRQLDKISGNGNTITYKYNANGIRTEKTVNGVTTKYYIEGDRIVLEKVGNEERAFWYDGDGKASAFVIYDASGMHPYYYIRNGQGDVIGLFDVNGTIVVRYTYDSWGNLLKITDGSGNDKTNDTTFVGYKNPLRYRGYYYDSETKLYYLQSRYYNPEWGRFINADSIIGANGDLVSNNLFAYCSNNPIMMVDPSGKSSEIKDLYRFAELLYKAGKALLASLAVVSGGAVLFGTAAEMAKMADRVMAESQAKSNSQTKSNSQGVSEELGKVAGKYGNFQCVEAAKAMEDTLKKKKLNGAFITINFIGGKGYVWSESQHKVISENGLHVGVLYEGRVYCNVHPLGLEKDQWINDFIGTGTKTVTVVKF